jgi:hypothetical protein
VETGPQACSDRGHLAHDFQTNQTVLNSSRFVKSFFRKPFCFIILRLLEIQMRLGVELFRKSQTTENKLHKNTLDLLK